MEHIWNPQQKEYCILGDPKTCLTGISTIFQGLKPVPFLEGYILIHDKTQQLQKISSNMQDE